jgi:hypothetical protein
MAEHPSLDELLPAARNFSQTLAEQVRAQGGAPAHLRRKRQIEDWLDAAHQALSAHDDPSDLGLRALVRRMDLLRVNELIEKHNRYYPIEANLPMDVRSGVLLERGQPWRPMTPITAEWLIARLEPR